MTTRDRLLYLAAPPLLAVINLAFYYGYLLPLLRQGGAPFYANYWATYGASPAQAFIGMLAAPARVTSRTLTSGFFTTVLLPHLFLPLVAWRWTLGILPIVVLYGASDNAQMREYGIYYAIVLVPFLVIAAAAGARRVARVLFVDPVRARVAAAAAVLLGSLLAGITDAGYSLRPWRPEIAAVPSVIQSLEREPVVLVQSGLYPHAGYDARVRLLTPATLADASHTGAVIVLAPAISAWPFHEGELDVLAQTTPVGATPPGLLAVRISPR